MALNPALSSAPITARRPVQRARALMLNSYSESYVEFAELGQRASVAYGPAGAPGVAGTTAGGTVFQGSAIANLIAPVAYTMPGLLSAVYTEGAWAKYNNGASVVSLSIGGLVMPVHLPVATIEGVTAPSNAQATLSFETDAASFGVVAYGTQNGASFSNELAVFVDLLDGSGYRPITARRPFAYAQGGTSQSGYWTYFAFPGGVKNRRVRVVSAHSIAGLVLPGGASLAAFNPSRSAVRVAAMGDSIGPVGQIALTKFASCLLAGGGSGGTGYAAANVNGAADNTAVAAGGLGGFPPSLSGNWGFEATQGKGAQLATEFFYTRTTDSAVSYKPDVILLTSGRNDSYPISGGGWNLTASVDKVLSRVRSACPDAILIMQSPHSGSNRGVDGKQQGDGTEAVTASLIGTMYAGLRKVAGPWIWVNNLESSWRVRRADGTETTGVTDTLGQAWQRGGAAGGYYAIAIATVPADGTNGYAVNGDGTHPGYFEYLKTIGSAVADITGGSLTITISGAASPVGFSAIPAGCILSVQPSAGPENNYGANSEVWLTVTSRNTGTSQIVCTLHPSSPRLTGALAVGDRVYIKDIVIPDGTFRDGREFLAIKLARCMRDALAVI